MLINDKNVIRSLYKSIRNSVSESQKSESDRRIFTRLINLPLYKNSDLILIYVSFGSEADTKNIIEFSLNNNKRVAVPYCNGNNMQFFEIKNLKDLKIGKFGIPTVETVNNLPVSSFENALCVVPGLCFDLEGNRIGYGGGFYDRFLCEHNIPTVALAYEICVCDKIPYEEYDVRIDALVTENYFRNLKKEVSTYE